MSEIINGLLGLLPSVRDHHAPTSPLYGFLKSLVRQEVEREFAARETAAGLHAHFAKLGVNLFAQKINWGKVEAPEQMPTSYHDGTLFVSARSSVLWG
jgi:hypothetical protein